MLTCSEHWSNCRWCSRWCRCSSLHHPGHWTYILATIVSMQKREEGRGRERERRVGGKERERGCERERNEVKGIAYVITTCSNFYNKRKDGYGPVRVHVNEERVNLYSEEGKKEKLVSLCNNLVTLALLLISHSTPSTSLSHHPPLLLFHLPSFSLSQLLPLLSPFTPSSSPSLSHYPSLSQPSPLTHADDDDQPLYRDGGDHDDDDDAPLDLSKPLN